jgi:signal peptidase II
VVPAIRADRSRIARVVTIAAVVVVLDQITKLIVLNRLTPGVPVVVVEGFIALTLVMNPGLAFGLLAGIPASWRWLVGLLSLVALVVLLRVALRILPSGGWREQAAIGLIFGGAVGNLIDRTRFGAVVDFVDVYYRDWHWPAFNVADSAITVGVATLALVVLVDRSPSAASPEP